MVYLTHPGLHHLLQAGQRLRPAPDLVERICGELPPWEVILDGEVVAIEAITWSKPAFQARPIFRVLPRQLIRLEKRDFLLEDVESLQNLWTTTLRVGDGRKQYIAAVLLKGTLKVP
jgi:hypothetical protein